MGASVNTPRNASVKKLSGLPPLPGDSSDEIELTTTTTTTSRPTRHRIRYTLPTIPPIFNYGKTMLNKDFIALREQKSIAA
ncbi:hypothetical protein AB6A40_010669 [Gnathostoma spinigerum]|uniref:Uncharacterized protein n=1 Tax=Gnathostoma spinigerum TaxID=75299 RepID=A0ABD6EVH1_9BILA